MRRLVLGMIVLGAAACGGSGGGDAAEEPTIRNVPDDYPTIQSAVDDAEPGDLVLIGPGTYAESVVVGVEDLTIRGLDRNEVVLDGAGERETGILVEVGGVTVENLTVTDYLANGVLFSAAFTYDGEIGAEPGFTGYRAAHVTATDNGLYGIYAFGVRGGVIEDSYASGNVEAGYYVGQCTPCDVVVRRVTAERNAIGYEGTNTGPGTLVVDSVFRGNRVGLASSSQAIEGLAPQRGAVFAGNLIVDNDDPDTPAVASGAFAVGILLAGTVDDEVVANRVEGHDGAGIVITDLDGYLPSGNQVRDNVVTGNSIADLVFGRTIVDALRTAGNCFSGNGSTVDQPADLGERLRCGEPDGDAGVDIVRLPDPPPGVDRGDVERPGPQAGMADPADAPFGPAPSTPPAVDLGTMRVPAAR